MKSLEFKKTTTGAVVGIVTEEKKSSIVWIIKKTAQDRGGIYYEVWKSKDNGSSGKLQPRIDVTSDENCYHKSLDRAKAWIQEQEFPLVEWCPECGEESRIVNKMIVQICEHCGSKIKPCTLCNECINCPL